MRFIDLTIFSPLIQRSIVSFLKRYSLIPFLKKNSSELRYDEENFLKMCSKLFSSKGFSLRTIEQCFTQVSIVLKTTPEDQYLHPILLVFLIFLKNDNPDLYIRLKQRQCSEEEILKYCYFER
jgi:hypothetical protein